MVLKPPTPARSEDDYYEPYAAFSRTVRGWLVGYGVGVVALALSQKPITDALLKSPNRNAIVVCLGVGILTQLTAALLYKTTLWYLYYVDEADVGIAALLRSAASWVNEQYWLELAFDVGSIGVYLMATWLLFGAVVGPSS